MLKKMTLHGGLAQEFTLSGSVLMMRAKVDR